MCVVQYFVYDEHNRTAVFCRGRAAAGLGCARMCAHGVCSQAVGTHSRRLQRQGFAVFAQPFAQAGGGRSMCWC